ncbi:MAG: DinB family protein [Planctomycetota bacterium]
MQTDEFAPFYAGYVALVPEPEALPALEAQLAELPAALAPFHGALETHRYAPGKWSVRQMLGHLTDSERIFGYRALRIARADATPLPGYDEDHFVAHADFEHVPLRELVDEWALCRRANLALFRRFDATALARRGTANGNAVSVRALLRILVGHPRHHLNVLRERYLPRA